MLLGDLLLTASRVEETIAGLDSIVNLISAGTVVDFPQAEAHKRHLVAAV